jgi:hypothetical protein
MEPSFAGVDIFEAKDERTMIRVKGSSTLQQGIWEMILPFC